LPPSIQPVAAGKNIFSDQQEADLGDVMAESFAHDISVIEDDSLNRHVQDVGDQLIQYLPPNHLRFRFSLIELPEANAFSLVGGRIYVSRKMVALTQSDDELAGVLAHEMGHIVTHQQAIRTTRLFHDVLGVTQVGDRADITDKYHRFLETWRRKPPHLPNEEEAHQYVADQVSLFAMARAGFAPHAYVDLWDRFQQTHGKTGSWFSDLFGSTKPEQRRLREMLKSVSAMPANCAEIAPAARTANFQDWQARVIAYRPGHLPESLPGLISHQSLALPLRPDIINLRFSPDGKYVLAQDDGGIHVLSRDPLKLLFFIDAPDAHKAGFSPDSQSVVFYTASLRVESWNIGSQKRTSVHEILLNERCIQTILSPDGQFFGCLKADFSLSLLDVASGTTLITKQHFFEVSSYFGWFLLLELLANPNPVLIHMGFSPEGHLFLAGSRSGALAYDGQQRREISLPGSIRRAIQGSFAFAGPDRIVAVDPYSAHKSPVLRFPTGERINELPLSNTTHVSSASHGDYVMLWPLKERPLGVMDLNQRKLSISFQHDAGDIYDGIILHEQKDGEVALTDFANKKTVAAVDLQQSRLGGTMAITVSNDFAWLAVSTRTRGAMWDLAHNIRIQHVRGFQGGWFGEDHSLYADFPKEGEQERSIVRLSPYGNLPVIAPVEKGLAYQRGSYLVREDCAKDSGFIRKDCTVTVNDFTGKNAVWSRRFAREAPALNWDMQSGTVLLHWPVSESAAHEELQQLAEFKGKAESDDYFFELLDFRKDALSGKLLVKTNKRSFRIEHAVCSGDWLLLGVSGDRVLTFSFSSGEEKGHVFGVEPVVSAAARQFAVSTSTGEVDIYDLAGTQLRRQFKFPTSIAYKRFSPDGKRLFVLTRDQTAYVLDLTAPETQTASSHP